MLSMEDTGVSMPTVIEGSLINDSFDNSSSGFEFCSAHQRKPPTITGMPLVVQATLVLVMFGIGCSTNLQMVWAYMKQPKSFLSALTLQLVMLPFLGFVLSKIFRLTAPEALGVIIQSVCPGGGLSNAATYWLDGDVDMSVVLTTASTTLAAGTMPLWLFVYPKALGISESCLKIPFATLGIAFLGILVPILLGLAVKYKFPKVSAILPKVLCSLCPIIGIVCAIWTFPNIDPTLSWRQVVVAVALFGLAGGLSYLLSRITWFEYSVAARRTVVVETVIQNSPLGVGIALLSLDLFSPEFAPVFMFFPLYFGLQMGSCLMAVAIYVICKRRGVRCLQPSVEDVENLQLSPQEEPLKFGHSEEKPENSV
ncbi:ileal sodium/bile acid cotransporter-like [Clavelina lepadiformis]|uniref:ileal sodium/bile acid cotransporter-like n=1 Tax=Clavelina lepadiformis TaxID=159417 RepID=UPI0040432C56